MTFLDYANTIKSFGREIVLDSIVKTRELIAPMITEASAEEVIVQEDVSYGNDERHRMDIFTDAQAPDQTKPVLIFMHGGGFVAGDKTVPDSPFYHNVGVWAVRNGFNAINMTYRLAPEHQWPSGVEDIHAVIQFIEKEGNEHGIDAKNIFFMGQSAGATHAASYTAHPNLYAPTKFGLRGLILVSGLFDFTTMSSVAMVKPYLGDDESQYVKQSSVQGLLESDIPILISMSENDPVIFEKQSIELLSALQQRHQQLPALVYLPGQNHMSSVLYLGLDGDLLAGQIKHFIQQHRV